MLGVKFSSHSFLLLFPSTSLIDDSILVKLKDSNTFPPLRFPNTLGTPPTGVETQGKSADIASNKTKGKPSAVEDNI